MPHTIELVEHTDVSIESFLVVHFYPLKAVQGTGMSLSFTVQPHIVAFSLFLSCSTSMASCDHFISYTWPSTKYILKKNNKQTKQTVEILYFVTFYFTPHSVIPSHVLIQCSDPVPFPHLNTRNDIRTIT